MPNNITNQPMYVRGGNIATEFDSVDRYPGMLGSEVTLEVVSPVPGETRKRTQTWKRVRLDSTAAVAPTQGSVAWWGDKTQYLVTTTVTALGRGRRAGVFGGTIPLDGGYCFVQTKGVALVRFIDGATSAPDATGKFVVPSATNARADCLAAGTAATYPALGRSAGAFISGQTLAAVELDIEDVA